MARPAASSNISAEHLASLMTACLQQIEALSPSETHGRKIDLLYVQMYGRCNALFLGMRALIEEGLAHEALLLYRPLSEDALRLHHLAALGHDERDAQIAHWYERSFNEDIGLWRSTPPPGRDADPILQRIEDDRTDFRAYLARNGIQPRRLPDETNLVDRYANDGQKWAWKMSQQMVHGNNQAHAWRFESTDEGYSYKVEPTPPEGLQMPAWLACDSLLIARRAIGVIFGWQDIGDLGERTHTAIEMFGELT
jgi:hypothetical protein